MIEQADVLADAIVSTALELFALTTAHKHEALLASPKVHAALPEPLRYDAEAQIRLLDRLAIHLAREVLHVWTAVSTADDAPKLAVAAAEAWAACPCAEHAAAAAATQPAAVQAGLHAWTRLPKSAAWAARTAAWVADAPKGNWQAVAAVSGACYATSVEEVVAAAAEWLARQ